MAVTHLSVSEFLKKTSYLPLIDVRSEKEFQQGHIPGAYNIPILNDEARAIVGTAYKHKGHYEAVLKGLDLVGHKFGDFVRNILKINSERKVLIYCWRGGMRSNIMSWILNLAGFDIFLLKEGYKIFRKWVIDKLSEPRNLIILGGMTGSGKTELLRYIHDENIQTIDLEKLANHKGSAFGGMGQKPQPSTEHFENKLALLWEQFNNSRYIWIENESRLIGSNKIPDNIYNLIRKAPVIEIVVHKEKRIKRILAEYGDFLEKELIENTQKIEKRLGGMRMKQALFCLLNKNKEGWINIMLKYYDDMYIYGMSKREPSSIHTLELKSYDQKNNALKVIQFAESKLKINAETILI